MDVHERFVEDIKVLSGSFPRRGRFRAARAHDLRLFPALSRHTRQRERDLGLHPGGRDAWGESGKG